MKFNMYHSCITVLDIQKSVKFYQDALNLSPLREINSKDGSFKIVFMGNEDNPCLLELTWYADREEPYNLGDNEVHIGFRTDDYNGSLKKHKEMNCVCFENEEMGIYFIEDPDGYWMEIVPER